ncbi:MAG: translation initiation factor IF-3 [Verrucomicrobiota bacterium]
MSRPYSPRPAPSAASFVRVNGKIRAREVRVIGVNQEQLGVIALGDAINMARLHAVDLVEIAPNANPPVCRLVDFGKYRYELSKKDKDAKKHQHANKVKEIQLSATIDPHDFGVKLDHAIDFLCEDMKVKITLRFRGREMAHKEVGFQQVEKFLKATTPYGHPDAQPKLIGRGINVMLSPLPRNKREKNPRQAERDVELAAERAEEEKAAKKAEQTGEGKEKKQPKISIDDVEQPSSLGDNAFVQLDSAAAPE